MNPFANPDEAVVYEYTEFPKQEDKNFSNEDFDKELSKEDSTKPSNFVHFLNLKDMPQETGIKVQLAIFQNFKDVLLPSEA
jgi:hypothetical protein